jgi:hypothetical protein
LEDAGAYREDTRRFTGNATKNHESLHESMRPGIL